MTENHKNILSKAELSQRFFDISYLNPNLETRILTKEDETAIATLVNSRELSLKTYRDENERLDTIEKMKPYLDESSNHLLIGCFEGKTLLAVLGMFFWESSPYWSIFHLYSSSVSLRRGFKKGGLGNCFQLMHYLALSLGRFKFYYIFRVTPNSFRRKSHDLGPLQRSIPELRLYRYTTEAILPPGSQSPYRVFDLMMGGRSLTSYTYIGSAVLEEPELLKLHRSTIYNISGSR